MLGWEGSSTFSPASDVSRTATRSARVCFMMEMVRGETGDFNSPGDLRNSMECLIVSA